MRLIGGPHQRCSATNLLFRVHVGLLIDQDLDRVGIAVTRGEHQRSLAVRAKLVGIRAGLQQVLDHGCVSVNAGQAQRRGSVAIGLLHVRPAGDQQIGDVHVIAVGGPLDGRGSVGLRQVHVGLLLD